MGKPAFLLPLATHAGTKCPTAPLSEPPAISDTFFSTGSLLSRKGACQVAEGTTIRKCANGAFMNKDEVVAGTAMLKEENLHIQGGGGGSHWVLVPPGVDLPVSVAL